MKQEDELSGFPELRKLQKKQSFQVPEGYFDALGPQISDRIVNPERRSQRLLKPTLVLCGIAAVLASVLLLRKGSETEIIQSPDYNLLIESGYVYELDESLLTAEFSTMFHDAPVENDLLEEYLLDQTDETTLKSQL